MRFLRARPRRAEPILLGLLNALTIIAFGILTQRDLATMAAIGGGVGFLTFVLGRRLAA